MADTKGLIERLREKCGTINFRGQQYAIFPPATDPLRLEAAAELERLSAEVARLESENQSLRAQCGIRQIEGYRKGKAEGDASIARLQAELEGVRRDGERLDFLEARADDVRITGEGSEPPRQTRLPAR